MQLARAALLVSCLLPVGCSFSLSTTTAAQPATQILYYYAGAHYYPAWLGGGWCAIGEPHTHDFAPDRPEVYAYEGGYYYYVGSANEPYVVGRTPANARIREANATDPHAARPVPSGTAPAPHTVNGSFPTRETHPAPASPIAVVRPTPATPTPTPQPTAGRLPPLQPRRAGAATAARPLPRSEQPGATTSRTDPRAIGRAVPETLPTEPSRPSAPPAPSAPAPTPAAPAPTQPTAPPRSRVDPPAVRALPAGDARRPSLPPLRRKPPEPRPGEAR